MKYVVRLTTSITGRGNRCRLAPVPLGHGVALSWPSGGTMIHGESGGATSGDGYREAHPKHPAWPAFLMVGQPNFGPTTMHASCRVPEKRDVWDILWGYHHNHWGQTCALCHFGTSPKGLGPCCSPQIHRILGTCNTSRFRLRLWFHWYVY